MLVLMVKFKIIEWPWKPEVYQFLWQE